MAGQSTKFPADEKDWERVLWKRLPYPDNYVPPTHFLASLRKNGASLRKGMTKN